MYDLFRNLIQYTGSSYTNIDSYILYGCISFALLLGIFVLDLLYRLLRSFIKK